MATAREQLAQFAAGSKALGKLCREYKNRSATVHLEELVGGALSFYAAAAVVELRFQMHILIRDRQHAAGDGEDVSHAVYGLVKRAGNAVHGS